MAKEPRVRLEVVRYNVAFQRCAMVASEVNMFNSRVVCAGTATCVLFVDVDFGIKLYF